MSLNKLFDASHALASVKLDWDSMKKYLDMEAEAAHELAQLRADLAAARRVIAPFADASKHSENVDIIEIYARHCRAAAEWYKRNK